MQGQTYVPTIRYFDTVIEGDATQDIGAVLSIVEDVLLRMRRVLPDYVRNLTFQSDNARTYQNLCLPLMLPELMEAAGFVCVRILHSETQDGKCIVDAHFQHVNRQIKKFIDGVGGWDSPEVKACTAMQIAAAITDDEGIGGTDIAVLRLDRARLAEFEDARDEISHTTSLVLPGMILDIRYAAPGSVESDTAHATSASPALAVQPWRHSDRPCRPCQTSRACHRICQTSQRVLSSGRG